MKLDSDNLDAMKYAAMAYYHLGKYGTSLKYLDEILKSDSDDDYYLCLKIRVLVKLGKVNRAYDIYKSLGDDKPDKGMAESLAHGLIDIEEYENALECLDKLNESDWLFKCRIVDGYKRIENHTDLDLKDRYDGQFRMAWISMIKSKSDDEVCPMCGGSYGGQFSFCETCSEEILMSPQGARIECDDIKVYYYICDKLHTLKEYLKHDTSIKKFQEIMDCLDDEEFSAFIKHLKDIEYVVEASNGYIWDGDVMKSYCDADKYAAPRWLAFPGYSSFTMGWRMGAGEDYCMNEPYQGPLFSKLFPRPTNWMFNPRNPKFENLERFVLFGYIWDEDLNPKYCEITDDAIAVNDFITLSQEVKFRHDSHIFDSIEHMILLSKYGSFDLCNPHRVTLEQLKNDFELTEKQLAEWEPFKYTLCLNASYYLFMQDRDLREKLLSTGDKCLVYVSDDEWGGDENLFGFALMQVRDEIRRLCEHEDLIDWRYTKYLKNAYPYINDSRDPNDPQSPEYRIIESTLAGSSRYVRDVNLDPELAGKYKAGRIITERGFVDASNKIGSMATTHRYLILSQHMVDFSRFEEGTGWGLHVANRDSMFKVLDIFNVGDKTEILLLHLPEGFEEVFVNRTDVEEEFIERERESFKRELEMDIVEALVDEMWLERCEFPLGMDEKGRFYRKRRKR